MHARIPHLLRDLRPLLSDLERIVKVSHCGLASCEECGNASRAVDIIAEAVALNQLFDHNKLRGR